MADIDWESFKVTYNTWNNTSYSTAKEWMTDIYKEYNGFVKPIARMLGISSNATTRYLKKIGVFETKSRGGSVALGTGRKEKLFLDIDEREMVSMTSKEMATKCGCTISTILKLTKKHDRKFKKG